MSKRELPEVVDRSWRLRWIAAHLAVAVILAWPALYNGFPVLFFDTGGYLQSGLNGVLPVGRSVVYGAFLRLLSLSAVGFWPVVIFQTLLMTWVLGLVLRARQLGHAAWLLAVGLGLAVLTALPWYTTQMMPDWLAPAAVLALWLLFAAPATMGPLARAGLVVLVAAAIASHMGSALLVIGLILVGALLYGFRQAGLAMMGLVLGLLLLPLGNWLAVGTARPPKAEAVFLLGRMMQDGLVGRYLAQACPDPGLRLCAVKDDLPATANDFLWGPPGGKGTAESLGGILALNDEAWRVVLGSLRQDPWGNLRAAITNTADQMTRFDTGDGTVAEIWHSRWRIGLQYPDLAPAMEASRQMDAGFDFAFWNGLHRPVGVASLVMLAGLLVWRILRGIGPDARMLGFVLVALVANAAICGVLSNPHDRYMSRMIWLATFAVVLVEAGRWRTARAE